VKTKKPPSGANSEQALSTGIMTPGDCEQCWAARKEAKELIRLRRDEFYAEGRAQRVSQWRYWIEQNENRMEALQAQVDCYEELERSARTEEFALGMRERIEEKIQTISRLEKRNQELDSLTQRAVPIDLNSCVVAKRRKTWRTRWSNSTRK
jgi:hypothetical protein